MNRRWLATLIAVSVVAAAVAVVLLVVVLALASDNDTIVLDLDVGDCFVLPDNAGEGLDVVDPIECAERHDAEVVAAGELNPAAEPEYPPDAELFAEADRRCRVSLAEHDEVLADFGILPVVANEQAWVPKRGRFLCVAVPYGGDLVTGSVFEPVVADEQSAASLGRPTRAISSVG